jgi:hypothetical protein
MPTQTGTLPVPGVLKGVGGPPGKVTRTRPRGSVAWTQAGPLPRVSPLQKPHLLRRRGHALGPEQNRVLPLSRLTSATGCGPQNLRTGREAPRGPRGAWLPLGRGQGSRNDKDELHGEIIGLEWPSCRQRNRGGAFCESPSRRGDVSDIPTFTNRSGMGHPMSDESLWALILER